MSFRAGHLVFALILFCITTALHANVCSNLANKINNDINKYPDDLGAKHLSWENIAWLQQKLGKGTASQTTNGTQYEWQCDADTDTSITVVTDTQGHVVSVDGKYNGEKGAGLFSTSINYPSTSKTTTSPISQGTKAAAQPSESALTSSTSGSTTAAAPSSSNQEVDPGMATVSSNTDQCVALAKQIHELAISKIPPNTPAYPWENLSWLQQNFGQGNFYDNGKMSGYAWKCSGKTELIKLAPKLSSGISMTASIFCDKAGTCFMSYIIRQGDKVSGLSMGLQGSEIQQAAP